MTKRYRERQSDFLTNLVLLLGQGLWALVSWPFRALWSKRSIPLDRQYYASHWELIELQTSPNQAILDADKLVDQAMRDLGISGDSFADRLKAAQKWFSHETYQGLWEAHKLRNQIAHEVGYQVNQSQARLALSYFRRALQSLGAL